ncbi:hypothetical protein [Niastella sp. OAS944]|uniref:XRE family transcriptional regulator n=1 Tax=Niastella sp. OAS944 TaxID=2664089 RepID=UPI00346F9964|nr:DNA-binding XRE family transcriptional regulator [Chitinophagaceae bacterium OAS944]
MISHAMATNFPCTSRMKVYGFLRTALILILRIIWSRNIYYMGSKIGQKLKQFRIRTGIKMPQIAGATGIKKEKLYKWEKGTHPTDFDAVATLEEYMLTEETRLNLENNNGSMKGLPLVPSVSAENTTLKEIFGSPLHDVVTITEDAMVPDYKPGWKLCIRKVVHKHLLIWGRAYYFKMPNSSRGVIRRVLEGEKPGQIKLLSKNEPDYPPIISTISEMDIYEITGVLIAL